MDDGTRAVSRIRGVAEIRRETIAPDSMDVEVDHFSIPALDACGLPERTASTEIDSHKLLLQGGEVLTSRLNPRKSRVHLVPASLHVQSVASTEFVVLDPHAIDARYLRYLLLSERTRQELDGRTRSATRSHERVEPIEILNLEVPTDQAEEQRRIADFLDDRVARIDQIIAARQQQIQGITERFESLRYAALLRTAEESKPSELPWARSIPASWHVRRLQQLATIGTGHTPSRSVPEYWQDCRTPWLTTGDVHKFRKDEIVSLDDTELHISELGLANSAAVLHRAGSVALSRTASAGYSVLMDVDMATSQDFVVWTCGPELVPEYLLQLLRVMRPYLLGNLAMGSTHKTIYFPDLMDLCIPLPPVTEQRGAVGRVQVARLESTQLTTALDRQVNRLQEYKQSLITAAVTGELDVTTAATTIPE